MRYSLPCLELQESLRLVEAQCLQGRNREVAALSTQHVDQGSAGSRLQGVCRVGGRWDVGLVRVSWGVSECIVSYGSVCED